MKNKQFFQIFIYLCIWQILFSKVNYIGKSIKTWKIRIKYTNRLKSYNSCTIKNNEYKAQWRCEVAFARSQSLLILGYIYTKHIIRSAVDYTNPQCKLSETWTNVWIYCQTCCCDLVFSYSPFIDLLSLSSLNFTFHYPLTLILLSSLTSWIAWGKQHSTLKTPIQFMSYTLVYCVFLQFLQWLMPIYRGHTASWLLTTKSLRFL